MSLAFSILSAYIKYLAAKLLGHLSALSIFIAKTAI